MLKAECLFSVSLQCLFSISCERLKESRLLFLSGEKSSPCSSLLCRLLHFLLGHLEMPQARRLRNRGQSRATQSNRSAPLRLLLPRPLAAFFSPFLRQRGNKCVSETRSQEGVCVCMRKLSCFTRCVEAYAHGCTNDLSED